MPSADLALRWKKAGLNDGDCVLLHSDIRRLARELIKGKCSQPVHLILESFIEAVGSSGTLLIPTFNFQFTSGTPFNIKTTPSEMGALTELARRRCLGERSRHPVYSFCAFGKHANQIHAIDNFSAYSNDSPFGFLRRVGGKIAVLDLEDQKSMTFFHHVEEVCGVKYRYPKTFEGHYISENGSISKRKYSIYVRDLKKGVSTNVNPAGQAMWKQGIYRGDYPGIGFGLRTASAEAVFNFTEEIIKSGNAEGMLFSRTTQA